MLVAAVAAGGVLGSALPGAGAGSLPPIRAVRAKADAYVSVVSRTENFGGARTLRVDGTPTARAYLRFGADVKSGDVKHVTLMVFSRTRSRAGFQVRLVYDRWREKRITFANAPSLSSDFIGSGPLRAGKWNVVDVTSLADRAMTGDGVSLALTTRSPNGLDLASRECGVRSPRLVVELGAGEGEPETGPTVPTPPDAPDGDVPLQ